MPFYRTLNSKKVALLIKGQAREYLKGLESIGQKAKILIARLPRKMEIATFTLNWDIQVTVMLLNGW